MYGVEVGDEGTDGPLRSTEDRLRPGSNFYPFLVISECVEPLYYSGVGYYCQKSPRLGSYSFLY